MDYPKIYLYKRIVQAKLFIDSNWQEKIDLENIANEASFSKFHFIRLFKKIYGKSPHQYLKSVRVEKAKQLLKKEHSVVETCYAVGFESISSFSTLFKRVTGVPPSRFLSQQKSINQQVKQAPMEFIPGCYSQKKAWQKSNFEEGT